ncbi:restriction endonuclease subunit S [Staphylococcus pettenkoferi]|uniref:restriction endonuclease subunit S n=1 Tax=Staphylococcus pettenkoferi TaxID=170573 RepID=UPI0011A36561|nr:restriction endonuclease subunit S [Staphylococcus pettenkoferi]
MTEQTDTPVLRFPEFKGEWEEKKLGAEVTFYSGLTYKPDDINFEGTFVLRSSNIKNGKLVDADNVYVDSNKINSTFVNEGDVIVVVRNGSRNLIGKHARVNTKLSNTVIGAFMTGIRCYNSKFINSLLDTNNFYREIHRNLGATINQITTGNFKKMSFYFPDDKEKEKIGEFFGKLDRQIELEEKKVELLEQQKRGYMQKIFSKQLRFKDENGNDYPNWAVVKLKDILSERKEYASKTENYPHATLSTSGITLKSDRYNRDFLVKDKSKKYKVTIMNDICYNPANLKFGVITRNRIGSVIFSPIYITFEVNNGYSPLFIELLVTRNDFINRIRKYEEGTVYERMAVKPKDFLNYETEIPCLEEQKKIGDFLVKIDKLIENQSKKIDFLKQRKQGLLQKMFV